MNIYERLLQIADEIEELTGVRPDIDVNLHGNLDGKTAEECMAARDALAADGMAFKDSDVGNFTVYRAMGRLIDFNVFGPNKEEA
jgi:hypothetical protein